MHEIVDHAERKGPDVEWTEEYFVTAGLELELTQQGTFAVQRPFHGGVFELEREELEILQCFARPATPGQAFAELSESWDVEESELGELIDSWLDNGLLIASSATPGRVDVFRERIERWKREGRPKEFPGASAIPLQRPEIFYPGLDAREIHDPTRFAWVARLEDAAEEIATELAGLLETRQGFQSVHPHFTDQGAWAGAYFLAYGERMDENCRLCPTTARLLESIPEIGGYGTAQFSALAEGTFLKPHCGSTNAKLRCQLPLRLPADCGLRVGNYSVPQIVNRCVIFDDSFLHTAWNVGPGPRIVLLFDFFHPDLTEPELTCLREAFLDEERGRFYLKQGELTAEPQWLYDQA